MTASKKSQPKNAALKTTLKKKQMSENMSDKIAKTTKHAGAGRKKK